MSLKIRILAWNIVALLVSVAISSLVAGLQARESVRAEVTSAMLSAERTLKEARDSYGDVAIFDESRHVRVSFQDSQGRVQTRSRVQSEDKPTPPWVLRIMRPHVDPVIVPAPAFGGRFVIEPVLENEIAELWEHSHGAALFRVLTAVLLVLIVGLVVEHALSPLRDIGRGLAAVAAGDFRVRVNERGPPEIAELAIGFNRMGAQLAAAEARNRALQQQLEHVQEEERADLARDLHDEIGSHLFAVNMDCATISRLADAGRHEEVKVQAKAVQRAVAHMQAQVRSMLERLRADPAIDFDLVDGLADLAAFWTARAPGAAVTADLPEERPELGSRQSTNLYRVAQEAVTNAIRHGSPTEIRIALRREPDGWILTVSDNGRGAPAGYEPGFGLKGMRERAAAAGAALTAGPLPEGGWMVRAQLVESNAHAQGEPA